MTTGKRQAATLSAVFERDGFGWLDRLAEPLQQGTGAVFNAGAAARKLKNVLNGTPLRHRMHPAIIIWPLGAWTTAAMLDALDGVVSGKRPSDFRAGADASVAFGIVGSLPAAMAGMADWVDLYDHPRRVGTAHALLNVVALGCYGASLAVRLARPNDRALARTLAYAGFGAVAFSGSLGGELVYTLGVNVPWMDYPRPPEGEHDVLASAELTEGSVVVVELDRVPVLLTRRDERVYALQDWCPHAGGPLSEGTWEGNVVECPWHGSRFCVEDGVPLQGPAAIPARTFTVRERDGRILLTPSYEGQSWPPAPKALRAHPEHIRINANGSAQTNESDS